MDFFLPLAKLDGLDTGSNGANIGQKTPLSWVFCG
jgi:hypothetical protein